MPAALLLLLVLCLLSAPSPATAFGRRGGRNRPEEKRISLWNRLGRLGRAAAGHPRGGADDGACANDDGPAMTMDDLSPELREATGLHQQLRGWDANLERMTASQRSQFQKLRPNDFAKAEEARSRLDRLIEEHPEQLGGSAIDNACQRLVWDSLADQHQAAAVAFRDGRVKLPEMYQKRIDRACEAIAEGLRGGGRRRRNQKRCLEVGCGCGSLVPSLLAAGVKPGQIHGVDLSPVMIRGARALYGEGPTFEAADFVRDYACSDDGSDGRFDVVIFSSSLHNMPDQGDALRRARSLLRDGGRIVVLHPQGASEILLQVRSDPVLVRRPMPTAAELRTAMGGADGDGGLELLVEPAEPDSPEEKEHGYLAVLQMK